MKKGLHKCKILININKITYTNNTPTYEDVVVILSPEQGEQVGSQSDNGNFSRDFCPKRNKLQDITSRLSTNHSNAISTQCCMPTSPVHITIDLYLVKQLRFILSAFMTTIVYTNGIYHKPHVRYGPHLRKLMRDPDLTVRSVINLESHGLHPSSPVALGNSPFSP